MIKELSKEEAGSFSVADNQIILNSDLFSNPKELTNTIAHETRHAYQWMRADMSETHEDQLFKMSHLLYVTPEEDWYGYVNQYVEVDARVFANIITEAMR